MKKIFDAGEVELADLHGDPSHVLEIQQKVKELLSANRQRREALKQEIIGQDAWALPGLINSTYTWMKKFEGDKTLQNLMSDIMARVAKDNDAASHLIFQAGVVENPFVVPRAIAINALENLNWKPSPDDRAMTRKSIKRAEKNLDNALLLDLYSIMMMAGDAQDMETILVKCRDWITNEDGSRLLARLTKAFPSAVETIIVTICDDLRKKGEYSNRGIARTLVGYLHPIPIEWVIGGALINATIRVGQNGGSNPRHKVIEFLWVAAVKELSQNEELWRSSMIAIESAVYDAGKDLKDSKVRETLYRYWFQSLNQWDKSSQERIYNAARRDEGINIDEDWAIAAISQLFQMQEKNRDAKQVLQEIEEKHPMRHDKAKDKHESLRPTRLGDIETLDDSSAGLTKKR